MSASVNGRVRRFFVDMSMALLIAAALAWRPADAQPARVVG